jgi:hypothetical protein
MTLDSADGRLDALTLVEGRAGSAVRETIRAWSPGASWASVEGSLLPPGPTRIEEERASHFTLYSQHAARVALLLLGEADPAHPPVTVDLDPLKHKTRDLWHCRLGADDVRGACYMAFFLEQPP